MTRGITVMGAFALVAAGLGAAGSSGATTHTALRSSPDARSSARTGGTISLSAKLTAAQETPRPKSVARNAAGTFTATLKGSTLTWSLSFSHLTGTATSAEVDQAESGASGPVVIALCAKCKSPASGSTLLGKTLVTSLEHGDTYVDVLTKKNPKGELRGQLKERT